MPVKKKPGTDLFSPRRYVDPLPKMVRPIVTERFLERQPDYKQLCDEVQYILRKRLLEAEIEVSTVTARAKTLNSFLEKMERKAYWKDPLSEITDLSGVRIVCLYLSDIPMIEEIIRNEFEVIEKVDKLNEKTPDRFGYGAIHFIVKLGKKMSGARYDDLKNLVCEIQLRTVLQDAWAIIGHHLVYKNEASVPKILRRKLNSLAGLFETADDQFQQIRDQREIYLDEMQDSALSDEDFLAHEVNFDSVSEYLKLKFPESPIASFTKQLPMTLEHIPKDRFRNLLSIDQAINETENRRARIREEPEFEEDIMRIDGQIPSSVELCLALCLSSKEYFDFVRISPGWRRVIQKHQKGSEKADPTKEPSTTSG